MQRIVAPASIGADNATGNQCIQTGAADALGGKGVLGGAVTAGKDAQRPDGFMVQGGHGGVLPPKSITGAADSKLTDTTDRQLTCVGATLRIFSS